MRRPGSRRLGYGLAPLLAAAAIALCLGPGGGPGCARRQAGDGAAAGSAGAATPNLLSFSRVEQAWAHGRGDGVLVAICDWRFDLNGKEAKKLVHPVSLVPGQPIGQLKPWHGEWMAEIVHAGMVSAPARPATPKASRDVYTRPYDLETRYEDG